MNDNTIIIRDPDDLIFMQDGAPCHKTDDVKQFLAEEEIKVMSWRNLLILTPIENVWQMFKVKFHQRFTDLVCSLSKFRGAIDKYGEVLQDVWNEFNPTVISNLIRSMLGHMKAVIEAICGAIQWTVFLFDRIRIFEYSMPNRGFVKPFVSIGLSTAICPWIFEYLTKWPGFLKTLWNPTTKHKVHPWTWRVR